MGCGCICLSNPGPGSQPKLPTRAESDVVQTFAPKTPLLRGFLHLRVLSSESPAKRWIVHGSIAGIGLRGVEHADVVKGAMM
jgi:hypothetical protein